MKRSRLVFLVGLFCLALLLLFVVLSEFQGETVVPQESGTVYVTETGEKYHRTGCRYLSESALVLEFDEALRRGYEPCGVCRPPERG